MKTYSTALATAAVAFTLSSCENPADKTTDANVSEAKQAAAGAGVEYKLTSDSAVEFTGSKVTGSHSGGFKTVAGSFKVNPDTKVPSAGSFSIDMASLYSDDEKLTGHLASPDFFDTKQFSESKFELSSAEKNADGSYKIAGNFTLHGVTKNISFPASLSESSDSVSITSEFDIKRKDFGIVYAGKADDLIRDEVVIRLKLKAAK
jgi:polyisoprenoid-binding protein YceI